MMTISGKFHGNYPFTKSWMPTGMGKGRWWGGTCPLEKLKKCFLLQMLSKTSVDGVFMHHSEKMSSASGGFTTRPPQGSCPGTLLGTPSFRPLNAHPWKKSCGCPCTKYRDIASHKTGVNR